MKENCVNGREILVFADKTIYSKTVILKTLYWYGGQFHTSVSSLNKETYRISLKLMDVIKESDIDLQSYLQKLERDLVDFQLRELVFEETKNVRDLLIAKAFAHFDSAEEPPGEIADPVGINKLTQ